MSTHTSDTPLLQPQPRRPFFRKASSGSMHSPDRTDSPTSNVNLLNTYDEIAASPESSEDKMTKSRSIMNLTSSTLFGIYAPTALNDSASTPQTPWGTGAETPAILESVERMGLQNGPRGVPNSDDIARRLNARSSQSDVRSASQGRKPVPPRTSAMKLILRNVVLCFFGVVYGGIVSHLQSSRSRTPEKASSLDSHNLGDASVAYLAIWGLAGVALGNLLPWIDKRSGKAGPDAAQKVSVSWSDAIRGVGSFVGVAFAIRRLPWETTLQLSLTLSLANPLLWYLLDGTSSGLLLSSAVGFTGTAILLATDPLLIPAPTLSHPSSYTASLIYNTTNGLAGTPSGQAPHYDIVATATWIASVLFCSCVCFGNIGRLLGD